MNSNESVHLGYKLFVALACGVFAVMIAISTKQIRVHRPYSLVAMTAGVHFLLSLGVFLVTMLVFKSSILPNSIPDDDYTALAVAFFLGSLPHIMVTVYVLIFNKELSRWMKSRYNESLDFGQIEFDGSITKKPSSPTKRKSTIKKSIPKKDSK